MAKRRNVKRVRPQVSSRALDAGHIFFGVGLEPLTDELIAWLAGRGWPAADLRAMRQQGAQYSRPRDSIMFPPGTL